MKRFKLTDVQADAILELKLRHLAKLEEMKIQGEQKELADEQADLEQTLKSKARLVKLIKTEIETLAEKHGDKRRTAVVEREAAQAIAESELVADEPVTVVLSERGWARAAKGHEIDVAGLSYRSGDQFLAAAGPQQPARGVHRQHRPRRTASARTRCRRRAVRASRSRGTSIRPDGASFRAVLIGAPEEKWVVASSAGYGFVVKLGELHSNKKAGKTALRVPEGGTVVPASPVGENGVRLAAASSDGRLLVFKLAELPELSKGKGNKILAVPSKDGVVLAGICVLAKDQSLRIDSGTRHMVIKPADLAHYAGERARRGMALPRGWRTVDRLSAE